jgi:hypothetical protein
LGQYNVGNEAAGVAAIQDFWKNVSSLIHF